MRQLMRLLIALSVIVALLVPALATGASASTGTMRGQHYSAGAYIVSLKDGVSVDDVAQQRVTGRGGSVSQRYHTALNGFAANLSEAAINDLAADARVGADDSDRHPARPGNEQLSGADRWRRSAR